MYIINICLLENLCLMINVKIILVYMNTELYIISKIIFQSILT